MSSFSAIEAATGIKLGTQSCRQCLTLCYDGGVVYMHYINGLFLGAGNTRFFLKKKMVTIEFKFLRVGGKGCSHVEIQTMVLGSTCCNCSKPNAKLSHLTFFYHSNHLYQCKNYFPWISSQCFPHQRCPPFTLSVFFIHFL